MAFWRVLAEGTTSDERFVEYWWKGRRLTGALIEYCWKEILLLLMLMVEYAVTIDDLQLLLLLSIESANAIVVEYYWKTFNWGCD